VVKTIFASGRASYASPTHFSDCSVCAIARPSANGISHHRQTAAGAWRLTMEDWLRCQNRIAITTNIKPKSQTNVSAILPKKWSQNLVVSFVHRVTGEETAGQMIELSKLTTLVSTGIVVVIIALAILVYFIFGKRN